MRFEVSLNKNSIARLSVVEDMIAMEVRTLDVPRPVTVTVTLTVDGEPPVTRQIVYASSSQQTAAIQASD